VISLLNAATEAATDTITGMSDAAEKLTLIGLLFAVAVIEGLVIRFLVKRLMAYHDRTEKAFRERNQADEAERRVRANMQRSNDDDDSA